MRALITKIDNNFWSLSRTERKITISSMIVSLSVAIGSFSAILVYKFFC